MVDPDIAAAANATGRRQSSHRVLVIAPAWVGDMVMTQSLLKALRNQGSVIDVVAPGPVFPLLSKMPEVDRAVLAPFSTGRLGLASRFRLARSLSAAHYQQAIVLPNSWKSALVPFIARIPRRTGYIGEQRWGLLNDVRRLDPAALPMTVQRFAALAEHPEKPLDVQSVEPPALRVSDSSRRDTVAALDIDPHHGKILALCPGAEFGPSKRWPTSHFAALARSKLNENWQVWLVGSGKDIQVSQQINHHCGGECLDLSGRTSLDQAVDVLSLARVVVSNDSGLMHVAAALGATQIALFGSSDPKHTPALNPKCRTEYLGLSCSPCFQRECPLRHHDCLQKITPDQVSEAIDSTQRGPC